MSYTRELGRASGGNTSKRKRMVYLVGSGVGVLAIWYFYQRRKASAAVAATTDTSTDPSTDTTGLDTGSSPALTSYTDPATGAVISGGVSGGTQTITAPSTNAQWTQQTLAYLVQNGFDPITVSIALGKYLANQNLTDDEYAVVQSALAAEGPPPSPPPPPHVAPPSGQTSPTSVTQPANPGAPTNFRIVSKKKGSAVLAWDPVPGATAYREYRNGVAVGKVSGTRDTVRHNGSWEIASVKGTYTSPHAGPVNVKGI